MAFRHITRELYDNLLRGFREIPGNASHAGRVAGCDQRMARRGWEEGWSPRMPWARAIKTVLREEQEAARKEQRRIEQQAKDASHEERARTKQDAVRALAQEGQMLAAGRANVLSTLASATQALPAVKKMLADLNTNLLDPKLKLEPRASVRMFREFGLGVRYLVEASNRLIEAERTHNGEPARIIGIDGGASMSLEEAQETIEEVTALYALARDRGLLEVRVDPEKEEAGAQDNGGNGNGEVH
jgi:hypothetical protein